MDTPFNSLPAYRKLEIGSRLKGNDYLPGQVKKLDQKSAIAFASSYLCQYVPIVKEENGESRTYYQPSTLKHTILTRELGAVYERELKRFMAREPKGLYTPATFKEESLDIFVSLQRIIPKEEKIRRLVTEYIKYIKAVKPSISKQDSTLRSLFRDPEKYSKILEILKDKELIDDTLKWDKSKYLKTGVVALVLTLKGKGYLHETNMAELQRVTCKLFQINISVRLFTTRVWDEHLDYFNKLILTIKELNQLSLK